IVAEAGQPGAVTIATNMAGRGTDIVLGSGVTDVGGLHIIGTERHESRRIDNQLRGRAGRQGDPGSSRFFISLEDDLMKIFGPAAERIGRLMDSLEGLVKYLSAYLPIAPGSQIPDEAMHNGPEGLVEHLYAASSEAYDRKVEEMGAEQMPAVERSVMLQTIDWQWMEYPTQMEQFREGIGLRAD